jgi:hypothetical protein
MKINKYLLLLVAIFIFAVITIVAVLLVPRWLKTSTNIYRLDADTAGFLEKVNNIVNTSIVSNDPNVYKAEYEAGFIQGRLQKNSIIASRDNSWDSAYLVDPSHSYPKQIPPSDDELVLAQRTLQYNWDYTLEYIRKQGKSEVGKNLRRLMYRQVGIYHGTVKDQPQALAFDDQWFPKLSNAELTVGYEHPHSHSWTCTLSTLIKMYSTSCLIMHRKWL